MKRTIFVLVLLVLALSIGVFIVQRFSAEGESLGIVKSILPSLVKNEPSPYSLGWGSELARVVDQDGNGIGGAMVTFTKRLGRNCDGDVTEEAPDWDGTVVTANEKGEFGFPVEIWDDEEEKNKRRVITKIEADGFLPRFIDVGVNYGMNNGEVDIFRAGRIEGVLVDPNGQPIANAPIRFDTTIQYKNPSSSCGGCFSGNPKSDGDGLFVIENVPPGRHMLKYPGQSGGCGVTEVVEVPFKDYPIFQEITMADGEENLGVILDMQQKRASIKGRVVDRYNQPMAGVWAQANMIHRVYSKSGHSTFTNAGAMAVTDENGYYVLKNLPRGEYQLKGQYVYEQGKNYRSGKALTVYVVGVQELSFDLVLERQDGSKVTCDGREQTIFEVPLSDGLGEREMMIVDPRGNGIAGARLEFDTTITVTDNETRQRTQRQWQGASLMTDERGVFTLPNEVEDTTDESLQCRVTVEAEGFEKRNVGVSEYAIKKRRFDVLPLCKIQGQLIGMDGAGVEGTVELRHRMIAYKNPGSASSGGGYGYGGKTTDKDGRFEFDKVPEGIHVLRYSGASVEGKAGDEGSVVVYTQGGEDVDGLVIDLREDTCGVGGRVIDRDGKAVKKAYVRLSKTISSGSCTFSPEFYRSELSNRKGDFAVEHIRPGVYEIEAVVDGKRRRTSEKMTIAVSDGQTIDLEIRLKP